MAADLWCKLGGPCWPEELSWEEDLESFDLWGGGGAGGEVMCAREACCWN